MLMLMLMLGIPATEIRVDAVLRTWEDLAEVFFLREVRKTVDCCTVGGDGRAVCVV